MATAQSPASSKFQRFSLILLLFLGFGFFVIANILIDSSPWESFQSSSEGQFGAFTISPDDPFDPFVDIDFTRSMLISSDQLHSSVQCANSAEYGGMAESDRAYKETMSRSCRYTNLFYRPSDKSFHYFPGPKENELYALLSEEKNSAQSVASDFKQKMSVSMDQSLPTGPLENQQVKFYGAAVWSPIVHFGENPPEVSSYSIASSNMKKDLVFTLYRTFYGFNLGHFTWDEILPQFVLLDTFDLVGTRTRHVPFFIEVLTKIDGWHRCHPKFQSRYDDCVTMYRKWFPPLLNVLTDPSSGDILRTGNWLQGNDAIGVGLKNDNTIDNATIAKRREKIRKTRLLGRKYNELMPNTSWVVLPTALAGIGRLNNFGCFGDCTTGRSSQRYRFRNFVLENILGTKRFTELNGQTPQVHITFSLPGGSSRPSEVSFFENFIAAAEVRYGSHRIRVEDMAKLSFKEQAELALNTAIFVTNHGGGSSTSIFLQKGASVLLYHTPEVKFDRRYYETLSYLRTVWIHPKDYNNTEKLMGMAEAALEAISGFYPEF